MIRGRQLGWILLLALTSLAAGGGSPEADLASLDWLAGRWRGTVGDRQWEAIYSTPEAGVILGVDKEILDGKLTLFEFELFRVEGGAVVLWPHPRGQKNVSFRLVRHDPKVRLAVFENLEHDFPQRITYDGTRADRLIVRVEADKDGDSVGFVIDLKRQR